MTVNKIIYKLLPDYTASHPRLYQSYWWQHQKEPEISRTKKCICQKAQPNFSCFYTATAPPPKYTHTKPPFGSPSLITFFLFVTGSDLLPILFYFFFTLHVQSDKEEQSCNWRPNNLNTNHKKRDGWRKDSRGYERHTQTREDIHIHYGWKENTWGIRENKNFSIHGTNVGSIKLLDRKSHVSFSFFLAVSLFLAFCSFTLASLSCSVPP
jgi:hypothetical protein